MSAELSIRIAIADDHKIFRDGIKMALKGKEYLKILWEAEDGKDLMHKMQLKRPDVLLMDIRMPGMTGIEGLRRIRQLDPHLSVIMLTGFGALETATVALRLFSLFLLQHLSIE